jgi:hypothetical protein
MERLKFLSPDKNRLFKFEGMGPLGAEVRERAFMLAKSGLGPQATDAGDGFLEYEWLSGERMQARGLTSALLDHVARYCAFRTANFTAQRDNAAEIQNMLEYNVQQEFGVDLSLPKDIFSTNDPVLADGRMQSYEWIALADGNIKKTDGISHGDDHFFPGPCDIAWDLAGIAIEWKLETAASEYLRKEFKRLTGKQITHDLNAYMLAYAVFRLGFCKMAISTVRGTDEEHRLQAAYQRYREQALVALELFLPKRCFAPAA